jgi:hypothetical protein
MTTDDEVAAILQFRARHRAYARDDRRYASQRPTDQAEFEHRIEQVRHAMQELDHA